MNIWNFKRNFFFYRHLILIKIFKEAEKKLHLKSDPASYNRLIFKEIHNPPISSSPRLIPSHHPQNSPQSTESVHNPSTHSTFKRFTIKLRNLWNRNQQCRPRRLRRKTFSRFKISSNEEANFLSFRSTYESQMTFYLMRSIEIQMNWNISGYQFES